MQVGQLFKALHATYKFAYVFSNTNLTNYDLA